MTAKVLVVDGDSHVLAAFQRTLRPEFDIHVSNSPETALRMLEPAGSFAAVIMDMHMRAMDAAQFLIKAREVSPTTLRFAMGPGRDIATILSAMNDGHVYHYITKPITPENVRPSLLAAIEYHHSLEVRQELQKNTLRAFAQMFTELFAIAEPASFIRSRRIWSHVEPLAKAAKVADLAELEIAVMLAEMGKILILPLALARLNKNPDSGGLQDSIANIPEQARALIRSIPGLERVAEILYYQDKHFDGRGVPTDPVSKDAIPLGARILKIAKDLDALCDQESCKREALQEIHKREGYYDPKLLELAAGALFIPEKDRSSVSRWLPLSSLRLGDVLLCDIETHDGLRLLASGSEITQANFARIETFSKIHNVKEPILVLSKYSDVYLAMHK